MEWGCSGNLFLGAIATILHCELAMQNQFDFQVYFWLQRVGTEKRKFMKLLSFLEK